MNTAFEATAIADSPPSARDERAEGQILKELLSPVKGLKKGDLTNSVSKKEKHNMSAVSGLTSLAVDEDDDDAADDDEHIAKEGDEDDEEEEDDENEGVDMSEKDIEKLKTSSTTPNSTTKRRRRGEEDVPMTFPQRLMDILSSEEDADIISWLPHGRGFMIYQKKRFAAEIMPKYLKHSKFTSFTRKLNRWNFTRITRGPETGAYYHEYFQRGNLRLCMQMCCQNSKNIHAAVLNTMSARPGMSPMLGPRSVGDAMNRLRLGPTDGGDMSSMGLLQTQLGAQAGLSGIAGAGGDETLLKLRQLEQQREHLLQQQQQQQFQQQYQQQQFQQQQQQQLAALGLGRSQQNMLGSPGATNAGGSEMGLGALQRSNANAYLAMIMAQEKVQAQMASLGGPGAFNPGEFQRQQTNLLQAQQQQLEQYKMMQAQAAYQNQQNQPPSCTNDISPHLLGSLLQQPGLMPGQDSQGPDERGKIKRGASAA